MDKLKNGSYSINNFLNQVQYSIKMEHNFVMRQSRQPIRSNRHFRNGEESSRSRLWDRWWENVTARWDLPEVSSRRRPEINRCLNNFRYSYVTECSILKCPQLLKNFFTKSNIRQRTSISSWFAIFIVLSIFPKGLDNSRQVKKLK